VGTLEPDSPFGDIYPCYAAGGVLHARRYHVARHRFVMISIFCGALVIAGLFTFVPGRIMHAVIVGH
jgi:uncharacterized membrane protein